MIKVGVIGLGRSGWEIHCSFLHQSKHFQLAAVCDQSPVRLKQAGELFKTKTYTSAQELISDTQVELVVISAPSHLHKSLALAVLAAGKNVIVEKPMTTTLADADEMLDAAERSGKILTVFHNRRWDRDYLMIKKLYQEGSFGSLFSIDSRVMTFGSEWSTYGVKEYDPQWRTKAAFGGGFLADWGPHLMDQCLDLCEEWPKSVSCELRSHLWATEVEDSFTLRLNFPSGMLATIEGSNNTRIPLPRWFIVGEKGTLISKGEWGRWTEMRFKGLLDGKETEIEPKPASEGDGLESFGVDSELTVRFYLDLYNAITQGHEPAIKATFARNVMAVLDAARRSSKEGKTINLDPAR
jgi:scyllo-inositol 2-dehydrogenase (NADP+)